MTDESTRQLKNWTYVHRVEEDNLDKAVERFRIQIENISEHLESHKDLEPPFKIEAQIRIVDVQEENGQAEKADKLTLLDWGDEDKDTERAGRHEPSVFDGMHNALMSNPDLREAFNQAREDGFTRPESFEYAYRTVHGDEYWEEQYADRVADEMSEDDEQTSKSDKDP